MQYILLRHFRCIQAREILSDWGLQLDPRMVNWDGRKLPVEKIHFGKTQVLAGDVADWGRDAIKSHLISTVSSNYCLNCLCSYHV